ncbi:c-type cytochrome [Rubellimicrobium aerolatum]|uniref:C-type cytochrome n=1 Tax=Rubellimicrobium aerolatum TaxID=490979 RepID=A0ABW0SHY0_9RHOB|nr:c-type cytochrome [Rubellimicrobium aerolatum]MBP1807622.1 mono/diheme cytochrome c family protein [Rubellimicrobium aerolatum]
MTAWNRSRRAASVVLALGGAAALGLLVGRGWAENPSDPPVEVLGRAVDADTLQLGQELYAAHCAACHGANLEGQPDWTSPGPDGRLPAPPHDASGHTWHHSDQDLLRITREGLAALVPGYQSDMPAFGGLLSDTETEAVLAYIKSTWPERERAYQAEATRNSG